MKSYFAKLAARATLANAPTSDGVTRSSSLDPFEDNASQQIVSPETTSAQSDLLPQPPRTPVTSDARLKRSEIRVIESDAVTDNPDRPSPKLSPPVSEFSLPDTRMSRSSEIAKTLDESKIEKTSRADAEDVLRSPVYDVTRPALETRSTVIPNVKSIEKNAKQSQKMVDADNRLAEMHEEQSALLRKADAFMSQLFDRREFANTRHQEQQEEDRQAELRKSETPREVAVARLQPTTPSLRVLEPPDPEPSLVIGKLSIEVVPPAPPPIAPQPQIVIIGGGRRTRAGIPSGHRFGFNRF